MPHWVCLTPEEQARLTAILQVIRHEKNFEGCGGLTLTPEMPLLIAAYAALLILNRPGDYYPGLVSVLVYPEAFVVRDVHADEDGIVVHEAEEREGEAWETGAMVLSWEDFMVDCEAFDGRNVVVHECAHLLHSAAWGRDASPGLQSADAVARFERVLQQEFEVLAAAVEAGDETLLDPYGAEAPEEFFAVATETFLDLPREVAQEHPALYEELARFYQIDPCRWTRA